MHFAFTDLSIELALEILRLASAPVIVSDETAFIGKSTKTSYYSTALALASVSYAIRQVTMPYLLHTVVLRSTSNVHAFINALRLQEEYSQCSSRLQLDYKMIRHGLYTPLSNIIRAREPRAEFQVVIALIQRTRARLCGFRARVEVSTRYAGWAHGEVEAIDVYARGVGVFRANYAFDALDSRTFHLFGVPSACF
ncbi:ectomycorrhiza-regulated small secreted protein [Laccaria bicolor S238N-H82]|uniref:Ectomycorrhiza-regulated small secreted protein n=1 Tax=Laccaria bicolor (strain S238N-H82 / ATCC MYA-4686) TaxID=486041 RepID=B0D8G0_LACBS|nr:ectomycorrhiza-regulated small secreted protein [Laccaria bicolor S238N-H82]EDR08833.1 ectomycorrhiza-regulated small secreted protein [Laccaria bicolor S238N-H82]|eukprot:XP_001880146.1 ectomycorrhiza-regulated small secreted protein [Laccaria bicolor S238N-H82]